MRPELLECFRGAQVIGIGEASHGMHEDVLFKAELVLALVDAGLVDTLHLEANHAGAAQSKRMCMAPATTRAKPCATRRSSAC